MIVDQSVAVSISSGIQAITSAYPPLLPRSVTLCILAIVVLMVVNLRGVRDSGAVFSVPTYVFIAMMLALIGAGFYRLALGHALAPSVGPARVDPLSAMQHPGALPAGFAFTYLILRGFAEQDHPLAVDPRNGRERLLRPEPVVGTAEPAGDGAVGLDRRGPE